MEFVQSDWYWLLWWMITGHYLADYPLQGDYMAQAKNRHTTLGKGIWPMLLFAHAFIHASFVAIVTRSITLALAELVVHAFIDYTKCEGKISYATDQVLHITFKVLWVIVLLRFHPL